MTMHDRISGEGVVTVETDSFSKLGFQGSFLSLKVSLLFSVPDLGHITIICTLICYKI